MKAREFTNFVKNKLEGKKLIGAEIGVWDGTNAQSLLDELDIEKLYLIDPWVVYTYPTQEEAEVGYTNQYFLDCLYFSVVERFKAEKRVNVLRLPSITASIVLSEKFDFVYIDGNHRFQHVVEDCLKWSTKLRPHGILGGHDWNHHFFKKDIQKAVNYFISVSSYELKNLHNIGEDWILLRGKQ